jgi:hypothetical protein
MQRNTKSYLEGSRYGCGKRAKTNINVKAEFIYGIK